MLDVASKLSAIAHATKTLHLLLIITPLHHSKSDNKKKWSHCQYIHLPKQQGSEWGSFWECFICLPQLFEGIDTPHFIKVDSFFCGDFHAVFPIIPENIGQVIFILSVVRRDMTERINQMCIVKNIYPGIDFSYFPLVVGRVLVLDDADNIAVVAPKDSPIPETDPQDRQ